MSSFDSYRPTWCPGCGNWGILVSLKAALTEAGFTPAAITAVFGIGCSGNMNDFISANAFHGLHGRALATAIGIKIANHKTKTIAIVGDGDTYGEGGNHLMAACRGNHDILTLVHNNQLYGLTTGQFCPTSTRGFVSKSTPYGTVDKRMNPLVLALSEGATFIAQAFAGNTRQMTRVIAEGLKHKGFALINILQPCVTFNGIQTYQYYLKNSYELPADYDSGNADRAMEKCQEYDAEKYATGIIYRSQQPAYHESIGLGNGDQALAERHSSNDFSALIKDFV